MSHNRSTTLGHHAPETLVTLLLLAGGLGLGLVLPSVLGMPPVAALAGVGALAGLAGVVLWVWWEAPVLPALRLALLASFACRVEVELFPAFAHDDMLKIGLSVSHTLFLGLLLQAARFFTPSPSRRAAVFFPAFPFPFKLLLGGLVFWSVLSVAYAADTWRGVCALWLFGSSLLACWTLAATLDSRAAWRQALVCVALMLGAGALVALGQYGFGLFGESLSFIGAPVAEDQLAIDGGAVKRVASLLHTPTAYAGYLVALLPLPLAVGLLAAGQLKAWQRLCLGMGAALGVVGLIVTYARGAWLAFGAALVVLAVGALLLQKGAARGRLALKLGALALVGALCVAPFAPGIYVRLTEDDNDSAASRPPANRVALAVMAAHPLTGVGLGAYTVEARRYDLTQEEITSVLIAVHNVFLHVGSEIGVPGLLFFAGLLACAAYYGCRVLRWGDPFMQAVALGLLAGLCGFLLNGLKEPGSLGTKRLDLRVLFLLCGLLLAAWRTVQNEAVKGNADARK